MNKLSKTVKRIVALGIGSAMMSATIMGALAVDLNDYPSAFMDDNAFSGKIVIGERAATSDLLGAVDIAASLQAASTTRVAVSSGTSTVSLDGDAKQIGETSDILEVGEFVGDVLQTLTEDDLGMLATDTITTSKGTTSFEQTLELDGGNSNDNFKVLLTEDNDDNTGTFLFFNDGTQIFNYELEFTSGLESDVESNVAEDLEDESLFMLGQYYSIVNADVTNAGALTLEFIAGDIVDTLTEGDARTYNVDGKEYEVVVLVIGTSGSTNQVKFLVNGEVTDSLEEGETDKLSDGLEIGVREVIETTAYRESDPGSVVEFYLGANKIVFDTSASGADGSVEINRDDINDASVNITYSATVASGDGDITINRIQYSLTADARRGTDVYVPAGEGLRENLDEDTALGMLNAEWDVFFAGVSEPTTTDIVFDPSGDDEYTLTFTNRRGTEYSVPYVVNNGGTVSFGDEDDEFIFWEQINETFDDGTNRALGAGTFHIGDSDYFVLSDDAGTNQGDSFVLQWDDIDTDDTELSFTDLGTGENKPVQYSGTVLNSSLIAANATALPSSNGDITMGGQNFDFWLYTDGTDYFLAVDMDGDGLLADETIDGSDDNVSESIPITVQGGGILDLYVDVAGDAPHKASDLDDVNGWNATLTTDDEDLDADGSDLTNIFSFSEQNTDELDVDLANEVWGTNQYFGLQSVKNEDRDVGMNGYGTWFEVTDDSSEADTLTISYPREQVEALVYVTGGEVQQTVSTSGEDYSERVNQLPIGNIAVLDSDVSADGDNFIVVGGPCVNTIAAGLLGNPANCAEGFTPGMAMLRMFDTGNNMALLVAGYSADDTVQASQVVARAANDATRPSGFEGESVEVVIAGANDVTLREAMEMEAEEEAMEDEA